MNYIKQLNAFYELLIINPLSSSALCLYGVLLHINNKCNWISEFTVANSTLQTFTSLSRVALDRARNELIQKKYIKYKKGSGNQAGKYLIVCFDTQNDTQSDIQNVTQNDTQSNTQSENINKHKQKHKQKHIEKENIKEKYFDDEKLNTSFVEWLNYKKQRKEKYTDIGLQKLITQINNQLKLHTSSEIIELIDTCISRNYKGIIFDMLKNQKKNDNNDIPSWVYDM